MRMPGLGAIALRRLNVKTVFRPRAGSSPRSRPVRSARWSGWGRGTICSSASETAVDLLDPGFHEPGSTLSLGVNLEVWNGMGDELRTSSRLSRSANARSIRPITARTTPSPRSLRDEYGVQPTRMPDEVWM